jgi:signal transduction histidine kinase
VKSQRISESSEESLLPTDKNAIKRWYRDPVIWFMGVAFVFFSVVFYATEFRDVLEDWFFDIRVRWSSALQLSDDIAIIGIDDQSIDLLETSIDRIVYDQKQRPFLSIDSLTKIAKEAYLSEAKVIAILMPNHAFSHADTRLKALLDIVKTDPRFYIGTTEYNRTEPSVVQIPKPLDEVESRIFGYETFRSRSNIIIRSLPSTSYRGLELVDTLPIAISKAVGSPLGSVGRQYNLHHIAPSHMAVVPASLAITAPTSFRKNIKGKIALIGYVTSRDIPFQTTEMNLANTPLAGNQQNVEEGVPLTFIVANALDNLTKNRTLSDVHWIVNVMQTSFMIGAMIFFWRYNSFLAGIATLVIWTLLVAAHASLIANNHIHIPIADAFIASVMTTIFVATQRIKFEIQDLALRQAKTQAQQDIAKSQSLFLEDFADWLRSMTSKVESLFHEIRQDKGVKLINDPVVMDVIHRSFAAAEEFGEYLESMKQLPQIERKAKNLSVESVDLFNLTKKISRRFEIKAKSKNISISINIDPGVKLKTNQNLLDSILFNLISNAVKYAPNDSTVTINYQPGTRRTHKISVLDEGPGIPEHLKSQIFEKFYRIKDERLYMAKGTGLGLYLTRFFAGAIGGKIEISTNKPRGSVFTVSIP